MQMFEPIENLEGKMKTVSFDEAKCAVECARREYEKKQEMEKLEARPAHIKAEEEIERAISEEICGCQDKEELEERVRKIFLKYFGREAAVRGHS